jgi:hypothetical protein
MRKQLELKFAESWGLRVYCIQFIPLQAQGTQAAVLQTTFLVRIDLPLNYFPMESLPVFKGVYTLGRRVVTYQNDNKDRSIRYL